MSSGYVAYPRSSDYPPTTLEDLVRYAEARRLCFGAYAAGLLGMVLAVLVAVFVSANSGFALLLVGPAAMAGLVVALVGNLIAASFVFKAISVLSPKGVGGLLSGLAVVVSFVVPFACLVASLATSLHCNRYFAARGVRFTGIRPTDEQLLEWVKVNGVQGAQELADGSLEAPA